MKLCVPTESDRGLDAVMAGHFGTAPYFTMIDLGTDEVAVVRNPSCGHGPGECHHIDILQAHQVQALACVGIGRRALEGIERAGIRVLAPTQRTVGDVAVAVRRGEVEPMAISVTCADHRVGGCGHGKHHQHRHRRGATP